MVKDLLITGLADEDIKKDVLGCAELDQKSEQGTLTFIEAKEMARNSLTKQFVDAVSAYRKEKAQSFPKTKVYTKCKECKVDMEKCTWNKRICTVGRTKI